jgi:hypothetical protein
LWPVATRIVGNDHEAAGIAQTYEARAIPAEFRFFRLSVEKVRIGGLLSRPSGLVVGLRPRRATGTLWQIRALRRRQLISTAWPTPI